MTKMAKKGENLNLIEIIESRYLSVFFDAEFKYNVRFSQKSVLMLIEPFISYWLYLWSRNKVKSIF